MVRVFPFILKAKHKTLHVIWAWAWTWAWVGKFCRKTICTSFDRSNLIFDRSNFADLHNKSYSTLDSNFKAWLRWHWPKIIQIFHIWNFTNGLDQCFSDNIVKTWNSSMVTFITSKWSCHHIRLETNFNFSI